jgi:hypothetical protein
MSAAGATGLIQLHGEPAGGVGAAVTHCLALARRRR